LYLFWHHSKSDEKWEERGWTIKRWEIGAERVEGRERREGEQREEERRRCKFIAYKRGAEKCIA
jgi:hypothetical protein